MMAFAGVTNTFGKIAGGVIKAARGATREVLVSPLESTLDVFKGTNLDVHGASSGLSGTVGTLMDTGGSLLNNLAHFSQQHHGVLHHLYTPTSHLLDGLHSISPFTSWAAPLLPYAGATVSSLKNVGLVNTVKATVGL
jgi:hypothetical protein